MLKSPRKPSVDVPSNVGDDEGDPLKGLDVFANAAQRLVETAVEISRLGAAEEVAGLYRGVQDTPVLESEQGQKTLLLQLAGLLLKCESQRATSLAAFNSAFAIPTKQFLRVDVVGMRELQERLEGARQAAEELQLRYDIARSSNKKKAVVDKLCSDLEHAKRQVREGFGLFFFRLKSCGGQYGLMKMNLNSKIKEFESRQRLDSLLRLFKCLSNYGALFESITRDFSALSSQVQVGAAALVLLFFSLVIS